MNTHRWCDGCHDEMSLDQPVATLEVAGPDDPDQARPLGHYCPRCWRRLSAAIEAIEELLDRHDDAHLQ
ncbi:hypothetical protein [Baekduia sp.]|jgi:hypothetical protein|uniref:hypothetical protein n=1 Tax=Baekduia sp. TaxID=2600305 RepID=UPI002E0F4606